ncbi:putative transferase CAF17 homolog, mitochondrial [Rhagoletis pomonella]|uniref:putative transferase CAF17 homolog, mitochondrial n=1 Tax=Rhagoletis pomonella TaxID=28610 RepID=UPI0017827DB7|nr:putative transferase CAF17 homolog, mitochondrial [Rhagoletis pomonella]
MNILKGLTRIKSSFARFIETTNNFMWVHHSEKFADRRLVVEELSDRELVRVQGEEVVPFLQGLITNDMTHLQSGSTPLAKTPAMYTMFLNKAGRVLYDSIIYRTPELNTYLIECDKYISNELRRHLLLYRVRRNIQIDSVGQEYRPWIVFNPVGSVVRMDTSVQVGQEVISTPDPRIRDLGTRVITKSDKTWKDLANMFSKTGDVTVAKPTNDCNYRMHRYRYGVGEGVYDLPPGKSFPLEANCDYLHGVSFHKGCYIGQELTARVHHTGVVRKRIMPLRLTVPAPPKSLTISTETGTNVGLIRGANFDRALGLLRVEQALNSPKLFIDGKICYVEKPYWWPSELPKKARVDGC